MASAEFHTESLSLISGQAIFQLPITLDGLVSGIKFPDDVVVKASDFLQTLVSLTVNDINVSGKIVVEKMINTVDYNSACDLISPDASPYTLILERE